MPVPRAVVRPGAVDPRERQSRFTERSTLRRLSAVSTEVAKSSACGFHLKPSNIRITRHAEAPRESSRRPGSGCYLHQLPIRHCPGGYPEHFSRDASVPELWTEKAGTLAGMKIASLFVLLLLLADGTQKTFADAETGLELRDACRALKVDPKAADKLQVMKMVHCVAYVDGIIDGWILAGRPLCYPPNGTLEEFAEVTAKYLEEHPEQLHFRPGDLVLRAMNHAWPCGADSSR
jgi:Rap1a immunity proteins